MSDAPERITAYGQNHPKWGVQFNCQPMPMQPMPAFPLTEYTRSDLAQAMLAKAREDALREAIHLMPRYFGVWSSTGVHIGVWEDGATAAKVLGEYPGGVMRDLIDTKDIEALIDRTAEDTSHD